MTTTALVAPGGDTCLPLRPHPVPGEALDSYLERLAGANLIEHPALMARLTWRGATSAHLQTTPRPELLAACRLLSGLTGAQISAMTLASLAGTEATPGPANGWRHAGHAWPPGRGTQLCSACLGTDAVWRIAWRHPWVTACLTHHSWLHERCPTCGSVFRTQRSSPLRSGDALPYACGHPNGARGRSCSQDLRYLPSKAAPAGVLESQRRIDAAIHHSPVVVLGVPIPAAEYLAEIRALSVLLLHLACQGEADGLASWGCAARADRDRSRGTRGARWGLAPPADPVLRGQALAAADHVLAAVDTAEAVERLAPWLDLTPSAPAGRHRWLSDHTSLTPELTRLVRAATSAKRRVSSLLNDEPPIETRWISQLLPIGIYRGAFSGFLGVTDDTGRLFLSFCLARMGHQGMTWADAATALGLPASTGTKAARAYSAHRSCTAAELIAALVAARNQVEAVVDYRHREAVVRHLARTNRWYVTWAHTNRPGGHANSKSYLATLLWTTYASAHPSTSPSWRQPPTARESANYRRWVARLDESARRSLAAIVATSAGARYEPRE